MSQISLSIFYYRILMLILLSLSTIVFPNTSPKYILLCIKENNDDFRILESKKLGLTNDKSINEILKRYNISSIGKWLNSASENDTDGEINLNKIFRVKLNDLNRIKKKHLINELRQSPNIIAVEEEPIVSSFYSPNDTYYESNFQCAFSLICQLGA